MFLGVILEAACLSIPVSVRVQNTSSCQGGINSLSNNKILDWSKLKAFADEIKVNLVWEG